MFSPVAECARECLVLCFCQVHELTCLLMARRAESARCFIGIVD